MSTAALYLPHPAVNRDGLIEKHLHLAEVLTSNVWRGLSTRFGHGLERDDVLQEARIALVKAADTFDPDGRTLFSTWATSCMRNALCSLLRTLGYQPQTTSLEINDERPLSELVTAAPASSIDVRLALENAFAALSPEDRDVLEAHHLRCETHGTIAKRLGVSTKTIQRRLADATTQFKRAYEK